MRELADLAGQELKLIQPSAWKMNYELRGGTKVIGTLKFRSSWGSLANGECAEGRWTFKRVGFLQTRVTIRDEGSASELAVLRNNIWACRGSLELRAGRQFLVTSNFWQTKLQFKTGDGADGRQLVDIQNKGVLHPEFVVTIHPEGEALPELPWILMLGCYLDVMMQVDAMGGVLPAVSS